VDNNNKEEKLILMEMKAIYFWLQHCEEARKNFLKRICIRKFSAKLKKNIFSAGFYKYQRIGK